MKIYLLIVLMALTSVVSAQVTISKSDMPVPGDTVYYTLVNGNVSPSPANTGAAYTWDYSTLNGPNQRLDSFIRVTNAPFTYIAAFNNPLDQLHYASVALKSDPPVSGGGAVPIAFEDFYGFFRSKSTEYAQVGVGATISINGSSPLGLPGTFDALDIIYSFPMNMGNRDSSKTYYSFDLQSNGYFGEWRDRHNLVDGYGTLITPYGTFETMRVKSVSYITDTIFVSNFPFKFNRTETVYTWLSPGYKGPVLKITDNNRTEYYDVKQNSSIGILPINNPMLLKIFPNPSQAILFVDASFYGKKYTIRDLNGKIVLSSLVEGGISTLDLSTGTYTLEIDQFKSVFLIEK